MPDVVRALGFVVGVAIVVGTVVSVFTTLVVPRSTSSRLLRSLTKFLGHVVRPVLNHLPTYEAKDRLIAVVGPLSLMLLFVVWLSLLIVGFGLAIWWPDATTLGHAVVVSGSSVFTLGVTSGSRPQVEALEIAAAGIGLLVIALEIAYLPVLYLAFSSRETEVTLLATRAGTPAWGPEVLTRHYWLKTMGDLPELYATWERWSAAVSESHSSYPSLMWFRSPKATRFWLTGLQAMMDAAALHVSLCPESSPSAARTMLMMGTRCLRSLAGTLRIDFDPDPLPSSPIRLTYDDYMEGVAHLQEVEFPMERTPEEAWSHFHGWRVNYEGIIDELTRLLMPPPTPWTLPRPNLGPVTWPTVKNRTPENPEAVRQEH
jgi:hypothetical protein